MNNTFYTLQPDTFGLNQKTNFQILFYHQSDIEAHTHAFFELVYILSGSAVHSHDGTTQMLSAGDYFMIDIGSVHSYQAGEDFSLYNFLFLPEFLDETMVGCTSFKELIRHCMYRYNKISLGLDTENRLFHDTDGRILQIMELLNQECHEQKLGFSDICQNLVREILIRMMRNTLEEEPDQKLLSEQYPLPIQQALLYFSEHLSDSSPVSNFCDANHYSREYISRLFKKNIGITPVAYIRKKKMEHACLLLSTTPLKVSSIAEQCGYQDEKTFRTTFKTLLGITPTEYRNSTK